MYKIDEFAKVQLLITMDGKKALMRFTFLADADDNFRPRCSSEPVPKSFSSPSSQAIYVRQNSSDASPPTSRHVYQHGNGTTDGSVSSSAVYAVSPSVARRSNRFITDAFTNFSKWIKPWKWKARKTSQFLQEKSIRKLITVNCKWILPFLFDNILLYIVPIGIALSISKRYVVIADSLLYHLATGDRVYTVHDDII